MGGNFVHFLKRIWAAQLRNQQVQIDYDTAVKLHTCCSVCAQGTCRQLPTEKGGSEDKKKYSSFSTLIFLFLTSYWKAILLTS